MAIEQKYIDLINADVDGEITAQDKAELDSFLAENDEARALHTELHSLCGTINAVETASPPPHLKYVILSKTKKDSAKSESPGLLQMLFGSPALKYAGTFATGALLALSIVNSNQTSDRALDGVTGMVGTVADAGGSSLISEIAVDNTRVAGQVALRQIGSMLILDFDLVADGPVEIEADYAEDTIWFAGFGQLESTGTEITAKAGSVTLGMDGKRRYAVYLQNTAERNVTFTLRFIAAGEVVHETSLSYEPSR